MEARHCAISGWAASWNRPGCDFAKCLGHIGAVGHEKGAHGQRRVRKRNDQSSAPRASSWAGVVLCFGRKKGQASCNAKQLARLQSRTLPNVMTLGFGGPSVVIGRTHAGQSRQVHAGRAHSWVYSCDDCRN